MQKIIKLIKREFMTKVITKGFLIGTVLGPFLMIAVIFGPAYFMSMSTEKPMTIQIVDQTQHLYDQFVEAFPDTLKDGQPRFVFAPLSPEIYEAKRDNIHNNIEEGLIDGIIEIPADIIEGKSPVRYTAKSVSNVDLIQKFRHTISDLINNERLTRAGLDPEKIKELTSKVNIKTVKIVKGAERERGFDQEFISSFVFLFILYMTIILYGSYILRSVIEEKTSRVNEVLLSSANSFQLMMGKLLGVGAVGLVQYVTWAGMSMLAFVFASQSMPSMVEYVNISPLVLFYFVLFFIIGYFTFSTLYTAVGAMCSDMQDAQSLSTPVTMLIIIPFFVSFMVIKDPTTSLAQILSFTPFFTPLIMFLRISLVMPEWWEILASIVINVITIIAITWLAARIHRIGILMYGKRPTVPEIFKWLRYS